MASALALTCAASAANAALVLFSGGPATTFADGSFSSNLSGSFPDGFYANGPHAAFNGFGQNGERILFNAPVTLNSLWLGKCNYCVDTGPASFTVSLYDASSVLLDAQSITASSTEALLSFDTPGVTKVEFTFEGGQDFYGDGRIVAWYQARDISYTLGGVPEPAVWALMVGGFGLAGGALRRHRRAAA
jgi:hypothetical protein